MAKEKKLGQMVANMLVTSARTKSMGKELIRGQMVQPMMVIGTKIVLKVLVLSPGSMGEPTLDNG